MIWHNSSLLSFMIQDTQVWLDCIPRKIKGYAVLVKSCRVCDHAAKEGQMARKHDCGKNWEGSAKAMEPSMVVEMVRKANETVSIGTLVGDDDTTTIARVCADVDEFNEKCSDNNHVRKSLANELEKVRDRHKNYQWRQWYASRVL